MTRRLGFIAALAFGSLAVHAGAENLGTYERIDVPGPSLDGNLGGNESVRKVSVYLPPSYAQEEGRRYPVIYLLHGFTDSDERWFGLEGEHFVDVPSAADAAWRARRSS